MSSQAPKQATIRAPPGLEGVIVADTMISKIDGSAGKLIYRGYNVQDLPGKVPFEAVAYLLWVGHMPNSLELLTFKKNLKSHRKIPLKLLEFLQDSVPKKAEPLVVLRTAVSYLEMLRSKENPKDDPVLESGYALAAQFPTILAFFERIRKGKKIIEPLSDLDHAANYLYMLSGKEPSEESAKALDSYLILLADHGMNASTFSARVTISTLTDVYSAIVAAIGTLKGPLHGGAPSQVWEMLQEIGKNELAEAWILSKLEKDERIMGFGHRIYRTEDPRSKVLKSIASKIADPQTFALATEVEETARRLLHQRHPERTLDTNVEFYSSLVLNAVGIPTDLFTPTFACSRVFGWIAHIMEQLSNNKLFRPTSEYVGPPSLSL
jgi:citrate synthase